MNDKHLHIVCLDVPYPADYGGAIEMFSKIKALYQLGIKIHLHCFEYGRGQQPELNKYCQEVHYYKRHEGHKGISFRFPYIVCSRASKELLEQLEKDDHPILLEGIHCTYFLHEGYFDKRKVVVRLHNVEHEYYRNLSKHEGNLFKKIYLSNESRLLKKYEKEITGKALHLAISKTDEAKYRDELKATNIAYLAPFIPYEMVNGKEGLGTFCLYHGNLSVAENEEAALWLIEKVFNKLEIPYVIAGKGPSKKLEAAAHRCKQGCLVADPSEKEMQDLICKAQINIIPSFNKAGIKFKLLNALFNGRHCIVNEEAVKGTGLEGACHIAMNEKAFQSIIIQLIHKPFTDDEIQLRQGLLYNEFNNRKNAERLIAWIY